MRNYIEVLCAVLRRGENPPGYLYRFAFGGDEDDLVERVNFVRNVVDPSDDWEVMEPQKIYFKLDQANFVQLLNTYSSGFQPMATLVFLNTKLNFFDDADNFDWLWEVTTLESPRKEWSSGE